MWHRIIELITKLTTVLVQFPLVHYFCVMPTLSFEDVNQQINQKNFEPIYFLHGAESFYIDKLTDRLEGEILSESEKAFNQSVLYGEDVDFKQVLDHCRQYPMMSERRVVIIREAQSMKDLSKLEPYLSQPTPSTTLVISYKHKKLDGRTSFAKAIKSKAVVMESKVLYDNQVEGWIAKLLNSKKIKYEAGVTALLAENLGNDLQKIDREIEKLRTNLKEGEKVGPAMVERYIGISRQYNVFELQKAMSMGDMEKVMKITRYFADNVKEVHPVVIVASLYNYFSRLLTVGMNKGASDKDLQSKLKLSSAFFIREYKQALRFWNGRKVLNAFEVLSEYDLKLKGVNNRSTNPSEILKEMMWRLMTG